MRTALCALALAVCARGADDVTPAKHGGWVFSGLVDGYFDHNGNNPSLNFNQLQNFDLHSGVPRLSLIKVAVD